MKNNKTCAVVNCKNRYYDEVINTYCTIIGVSNVRCIRSSLFYNMSARHERHKFDTNDTSTTRVWHQCDMCETQTTQGRHECCTNDTGATLVRNFDFDNNTSENIFSHSFIYMANERLQGEEQFHSKKCLVPMPKCIWEVHHKNWTL